MDEYDRQGVISKFADVCHDLGIGNPLVVSLNGAQPGALAMAEQRGVTIWGQDEISRHVGASAVLDLQHRPMVEEVGFPSHLDADGAEKLVAKATSGTLGLGKETVTVTGNVWLPVAVVPLTLLKAVAMRRKSATTQMWAVYDLIGGTFLTGLDEEPERTPVAIESPKIAPHLKPNDPVKHLNQVVERFEKATRDDTIKKYRSQLDNLGVPCDATAHVWDLVAATQ